MEKSISKLVLGEIGITPQELEKKYGKRIISEGAKVTRLGPSPTGFIHLGNLYGAFVDERLANQSGGRMYLRIEDTDDKRYVDGAVDTIIDSLSFFDIEFDEGVTKSGQIGEYGPYCQSERGEIYKAYVKELLDKNMAYPCFLTEEELQDIREEQLNNKETPGVYGKYARYRNLIWEEIKNLIDSGKEYVIRLKSDGVTGENAKYIEVDDAIRGKLSMPENFQDTVILKKNGMPTYHFAHVVDDHLMRTTHVVRGEEWLSSLPTHIELFEKLGFEIPVYCHTAQLMKVDESGNKRKLSKRKDPELSLDFYKELGYHKEAIKEYLLTILNSNFEEWRIENSEKDWREFNFSLEKMSTSGALFDLNKLNDVSKDVLLRLSVDDIYEFLLTWSSEYDKNFCDLIKRDRELTKTALNIGRYDAKPRKDLVYGRQIAEFINYFYDELFEVVDDMPEQVSKEDAKTIISKYLETYSQNDNQEEWFEKIRSIGSELGYALKPKDYKKNPEEFKGHIGHVSTVIRLGVVGKSQSPDMWEIQQLLGESRVRQRLIEFNESL